jgi:arylsulfatase A-like enzyme
MKWIIVCIVGVIAAAFIVSVVVRHPAVRPNVVLVSIDTLRADRLSCYGYGKPTSPFIDSLARDGIMFRDTIAQANWTLPSHVSLFTSLYPDVHRVQQGKDKMGGSFTTMAEILKRNGYGTAAFVDGGVMAGIFGFGQGFDLYDDMSSGDEKDKRVVNWIDSHGDKPFFLFYHTYDVHCPYRYHPHPRDVKHDARLQDIARRINAGDLTLTDEELAQTITAAYTDRDFLKSLNLDKLIPIKKDIFDFMHKRWRVMPGYNKDQRYISEAYDAGVMHVDGRLSRLWDRLREQGLDNNTVLIITSDHGECLMEHGALGHPPLLYDEIVRVPLVMVYPGSSRTGVVVDSQVMSIDILPTVLDLLSIESPSPLQGRSLVPLMTGAGSLDDTHAYADAYDIVAVRGNKRKYIRKSDRPVRSAENVSPEEYNAPDFMRWAGIGGPDYSNYTYELYDLENDPGEREDVASEDPDGRTGLSDKLKQWENGNRAAREGLGLGAAGEKAELDAATVERLKSLGYVQ